MGTDRRHMIMRNASATALEVVVFSGMASGYLVEINVNQNELVFHIDVIGRGLTISRATFLNG